MINIIVSFFVKKFFYKPYTYFVSRNYYSESYEFNFQNIFFADTEYLKKIFLSNKFFTEKNINELNLNYHSFDWLNIAKKIGGAENVTRAKNHIFNWYKKKYYKILSTMETILICKRFINIIYNYDFFALTASESDKKKIHKIILEHYILVNFAIKNKKYFDIRIEELKALILGSFIYQKNIDNNLYLLTKLLTAQIDRNGFHKSYSSLQQAEFLNNLHEIKNIILFFKESAPKELIFQITNMSSVLMNFLHKDGSLALFNGSNNFYIKEINQLIRQETDIKPKEFYEINNGISSYTDKNKKIFMDVVLPTSYLINNNLHASTLSFELSCLNEKIITNCGSVEKRVGQKPEYLRYSAAHSTIILNNTNISELVAKKSYKRTPKNIYFNSEINEGYTIWNASHDGYLNNFNKIIRRKLIIANKKNLILGEDSIIPTKLKSKKISYSIRFHLMPYCNCLLTNDKKSIIIKTKLNQTWIFKSNSLISLENSVYIGNGKRIEQNNQIVINGTIDDKKKIENWSFTKS